MMHKKTEVAQLLLTVALLAGGLLFSPPSALAQDLHPSRRLSPVGIAKAHIGEAYAKVTYGRPYMRGRQIFGHNNDSTSFLVPYGEFWRTGANEATEITLTRALSIGGRRLAAGTYSIFAEPGEAAWTLHFSPQLGLDGTGRLGADGTFTPDVYDPALDVLVASASVRMLDEEVDPFTIAFEPEGSGAYLVLRWEKTEARVLVTAAE